MSQPERPQVPSDIKEFNRKLIEEFRANQGRLSGPRATMQILLLTTKGRRSGQDRTVVVGYRPSGAAMVAIASGNGAPEDPQWYRNLQAEPRTTVEVGDSQFEARARTAKGEERERLATLIDYLERQQALTSRQIPIVILEPVR